MRSDRAIRCLCSNANEMKYASGRIIAPLQSWGFLAMTLLVGIYFKSKNSLSFFRLLTLIFLPNDFISFKN
jgi:hypothetical protein